MNFFAFVASLQKISASKSSFIFATHFHKIIKSLIISRNKGFDEAICSCIMYHYHMHVVFDKEQGRLLYDHKLKPGESLVSK